MSALEKSLPPVPDKKYFSIGEVAYLCALKPHVLRYWEQEFSQLRPLTRGSGRRYYKRKDIDLIRLIRTLLYDRRYTIAGAKQALQNSVQLPEPAVMQVSCGSSSDTIASNKERDRDGACLLGQATLSSEISGFSTTASSSCDRQFITMIKQDLENLLKSLK